MRRKYFLELLSLVVASMILVTSCGNNSSNTPTGGAPQQVAQPAETTPQAAQPTATPQYISKEDLKTDIEGEKSYIILDVRKAADYATKHIKGAFSGDVDSSVSNSDNGPSTTNLKAALKEATGSESGNSDSKFVLVCYSGKRYAAAATGILEELGIPAGNIYILEGGNNDWS